MGLGRLSKRLGLLILALALIAGWAPVTHAAPAAAPAPSAEPDYRTHILLIPEPGRLKVRFSFSRPIARFRFANPVEAIQSDTWAVATPSLTLAKGIVAGADGAPFSDFELIIRPDSRQRDRLYPALSPVGSQGWLLYAGYLQPAQSGSDLTIEPRPGWITVRSEGTGLITRGYAYLGPASQMSRGAVTVITGDGTPEWLSRSIREDTEASIAFFAKRMSARLERKPILVIDYAPERDAGWRGDTSDGMVAVRFYSRTWAEPSEQARAQVSRFIAHEFFHLWNSNLFTPSENDADAWLHEGAAEYAALMSARASGRMSNAALREELSRNYAGCARWLGEKGLIAHAPKAGSAIYQCGTLVQWLADLQTRHATEGRRDVLDVWRGVFYGSLKHERRYAMRDFLERMPPENLKPGALTRLVLDPGGATRWADLAQAMAPLGAVMEARDSPEQERVALIFHVLGQSCASGSIGFWTEPDHLKLDSEGACGAISGSPQVDSVLGHNLLSDTGGAFDAVAAACLAKAPVTFTLNGKPAGTAVCEKPLGERPKAWTVVKTSAP